MANGETNYRYEIIKLHHRLTDSLTNSLVSIKKTSLSLKPHLTYFTLN